MLKNVGKLYRTSLVYQRLPKHKCYQRTLSTNIKNTDVSNGLKDVSEEKQTKQNTNPFAAQRSTKIVGNDAGTSLSLDEKERRLKVLQLEVDIACQEGRRVPALESFRDSDWEHVLELPTKSARFKYYSFLWQVEIKKMVKKRKKEEKAATADERIQIVREERANNDHIIYGLGHVSMFLRIYDTTMNHWFNNRLTRAMQFSPKIVLDCSYDEFMIKREAENAAKQLMLCFADNRLHDDPFDLHYCNVNLNTPCMRRLQSYIPTMLNADFPMNVHRKCFTEIFPKENIVYLTPHCHKELVEYNPDDVYVVGAMVDKVNNEPLSLAKAKRLGLRMACLPLDRYLQWSGGSGKSLTLNQMINIMLDLKKTGDWMTALRHVPRRKLIDLKSESEKFRNGLHNRANRYSIRVDRIMDEGNDDIIVDNAPKKQVRSHRENLEFNLSTWGSKKKERNGS